MSNRPRVFENSEGAKGVETTVEILGLDEII